MPLPESLRKRIKRVRLWRLRRDFGRVSRVQAFGASYRDRWWGKLSGEVFYSGSGSDEPFASDYCRLIEEYAAANHVSSVVDLGCGDFRIGRRIAAGVRDYCGVDIVPELVEYNHRRHGIPGIRFVCLDIVDDELPPADLCLLRQVLQHLSNAEISRVLANLRCFPHVIVTEHVPSGAVRRPNLDKPHGPDTRLEDGSGVFVTLPPFSCSACAEWELAYDERSKFLAVAMER